MLCEGSTDAHLEDALSSMLSLSSSLNPMQANYPLFNASATEHTSRDESLKGWGACHLLKIIK